MSAAIAEPEHEILEKEPMPQSVPGRLGSKVTNYVKSWFGSPWDRRLAKAALAIPAIRRWEREYENMSEDELRKVAARLRGRARGGENLDKMLPEAFGLVCIAAQRVLKMRPFDVQLAEIGRAHV